MSNSERKSAPDGASQEAADSGAPAASKSKKRLLLMAVACLVLTAGGGVGFLMMSEEDANAVAVVEERPMLRRAKIDTFIANLSENTSFVKVGIVVEYDLNILNRLMDGLAEGGGHAYGGGAAGKKGGGDPLAMPPLFIEREPMIRHAIIKTLSSRRSEEILSADGKESLRDDLLVAINEALSEDEAPVVQVYFTEFIIQ